MTDFTIGPWRRVTPRVLTARCEPHGVTVGLVIGDDRAALVDAGSSPAQGETILAAARAEAGVEVSHVVVTHAHHDHWFGIAGMPGVISVAHEDLLLDPEPEVLSAARRIGLEQLPGPDVTLSLMWALDLGGVRLEVLHFGPAHTGTDLFVVVPEEDVIFVGDALESDGDPCFSTASSFVGWPKALDGVLGASRETTRFVPGHGPVVDRDFCFRQRAELAMVQGTTETLFGQGTGQQEALTTVEWPFTEATMTAVLPLAWAELTARGIPVRRTLPLV
ncbi:MBL fold metallo-hydrolase [Arachnia propionica]|uniref:MBL fold metallo-hydrolase n=1 Tax=Arachnia propionica TaxID=1750 RepID=A0A3P1TFH5_9ACTN|nr:MBL fold metallo-hydrolase [Arachnia propionica]RRD07303.1 MBL fold metallo-hydrolase [Arachnia propionica]